LVFGYGRSVVFRRLKYEWNRIIVRFAYQWCSLLRQWDDVHDGKSVINDHRSPTNGKKESPRPFSAAWFFFPRVPFHLPSLWQSGASTWDSSTDARATNVHRHRSAKYFHIVEVETAMTAVSSSCTIHIDKCTIPSDWEKANRIVIYMFFRGTFVNRFRSFRVYWRLIDD